VDRRPAAFCWSAIDAPVFFNRLALEPHHNLSAFFSQCVSWLSIRLESSCRFGLAVHYVGHHGQRKFSITTFGGFNMLEELLEEVERDFYFKVHCRFHIQLTI
jgi:hypothetical protein